ncbi:MAG: hypothetical protein FP820_11630 [Sulfurimonas sp.]|nr:hypothetical protein [Sulfurimonas sp.]MBU1216946.1 hypothetical protein [bacterium]MBU1435073.1 hypothetical protein [bacterium]MBU1504178.1 hypothetical protein [bacterium]MBU3938168.1 hypothetical protein [bacterium]
MKCEKCGKEYLTKECVPCRDKHHYYNKNEIENMKLKHNGNMLKIGLGIISVVVFFLGAGGIIKIANMQDDNEKLMKDMELLNAQNNNLKRKNLMNETLVNDYKRTNIELKHELRSYKSYVSSNSNRQVPTNNQNVSQYASKVENKNTNQNYAAPERQKENTYTAQRKKTYIRYGQAKLVSDSRIEVMSDNRLKSTMPIYGKYINKSITSPDCGSNERIYKIVNECSANVSLFEQIYFKQTNADDIQNHNRTTHMVECLYNYENGVMHDCMVKMKS